MRYRNVPPRANSMVEALRGLGYSAATAIADIVDNSISAGAKHVAVIFKWAGRDSSVSLIDNGSGMTDPELEAAMRLGDKNPLSQRSTHDLGRFGLGLKTASFSQCRRLTVCSKQGGEISCLHWDLDLLASSADHEWHLLEGPPQHLTNIAENLKGGGSGTVVHWDKLDRIVSDGSSEQNFLDMIDSVERHLAMVFNEFLEPGQDSLVITINGKPVAPWDPFLRNHPATQSSPIVQIPSAAGKISVQSYVLPHRDRVTETEYESAAGPDGWTAQQGFYVYRNRRMLVSGSWLGLGRGRGKTWTKEEAHRLARIRLDIPNTADSQWKIDIRKSTARPPAEVRAHLLRLAEDVRDRARKVFVHRGQVFRSPSGKPVAQVWRTDRYAGGLRYRIEETHPAVRAVLDDAGQERGQILAMLRVIEETVPVQRIWLDTADNKDPPQTGFLATDRSELSQILQTMFRNMVHRKGYSVEAAVQLLLHTEPFQNYPELIKSLPDSSE